MSKIIGRPLYAPAPAGGGKPSAPKFTYDGDYVIRDDGVVELLTSGTLVFMEPSVIDIFCVGGGSSGLTYFGTNNAAGGGAGGYTKTIKKQRVSGSYAITIGAGGVASGQNQGAGGATSFGSVLTANGGGLAGSTQQGAPGGCGGGGAAVSDARGGTGGSDGGNGENSSYAGGAGQGSTTREFGEATGKLYAGGGGGGRYISASKPVTSAGGSGGGGTGAWYGGYQRSQAATAGVANTGGGGGGGAVYSGDSYKPGAPGGSGICCFREAQELPELAGTWVLNERLYAPEFGPSAIGKQTSQAVTFTAGSDTFTSFVFYWPSVNDNNMYYQNSAKTTVVYNFVSNTYFSGVIKTITFPAGATASDEFRAWLASNATKQTA